MVVLLCGGDKGSQTHVGCIAESLNFTLAPMAKIDAAYLKAFPGPVTLSRRERA